MASGNKINIEDSDPVVQRSLLPARFPSDPQPCTSQMAQRTTPSAIRFSSTWSTTACIRLVRLGPSLDEELWVGADDMRVQGGDSQVRHRVAWVRVWSENVGVAVEAA